MSSLSKRTLTITVLLLCLMGGGAYLGVTRLPSSEPVGQPSSSPLVKEPQVQQIICTGRVESTFGEVDVCAQIAGELAEVRVTEGDVVEKGQTLAVLEASREKADVAVAEANVAVARAKLNRIRAGVGEEEKQEALSSAEATEALLAYERKNVNRLLELHRSKAVSLDDLQRVQQQVEHLTKQAESLRKHLAALQRGPIKEEVEAAATEVSLAEQRLYQANVGYNYRIVRAPCSGTVLQVHRHTGDSVGTLELTPIIRLIDTSHLRIRLEIEESDVNRLKPDMVGTYQVRGTSESVGRLKVRMFLPEFGPKRLFNPDSSARIDTRILNVLCEITSSNVTVYPGQRITAYIPIDSAEKPASTATVKTLHK